MKKKIVFFHHGVGLGGAPISMVKIIQSLDSEKFESHVLLLKDSNLKDYLEKNNISYSVVDHIFYRKFYRFFPHIVPSYFKFYEIHKIIIYSFFWILSRFFFSKKVFEKIDADIVHFNSLVLNDFLSCSSKKFKTVIHIREPIEYGYLGIRNKIISSQINKYADSVIAISNDNANRLKINKKINVIYNFNEINDLASSRDIVTNKILYVGGCNEAKGFSLMVDSLKYLDDNIEVFFCGSYDLPALSFFKKIVFFKRNKIKEKILLLKNSNNAKVIGLTDNIEYYLKSSDILVNPFIKSHFSRPIIEAFSFAKPIVCTNIEGMDELIINGYNGVIIDKNTPENLALHINKLMTDKDKIFLMGLNGYNFAKEVFSNKNVKKIEKIYNQLLLKV